MISCECDDDHGYDLFGMHAVLNAALTKLLLLHTARVLSNRENGNE